MRVVLTIAPGSAEFTAPNTTGPYPYLVGVSTLRMAARAGSKSGIAVGESSNVTVRLHNGGRKVARMIGRPLRAPCVVYDDDDSEFFRGYVSGITLGAVVELRVEA